jgi:hypothetical protein
VSDPTTAKKPPRWIHAEAFLAMQRLIETKTMTITAPGHCRITHGPHDCYFENVVGKAIGSIRRSLATVYSIPHDAEPRISGSVVDGQYRLRSGDDHSFREIACQS